MNFIQRFEVAETRSFPWAVDFVVPAVIFIIFGSVGREMSELVASLLLVAPLVLRRRYPLVMMFLISISGVYTLIAMGSPPPAIVTVPMSIFSTARWVRGPTARISVLIGAIGSVAGPARWALYMYNPSQQILSFVLLAGLSLGLVLTCYVVGRRLQETVVARELEQQAVAERYQRMLHAREQATRMAEARARTDIARELHDIVAHSLSVMIVQAEGGRALAAKHPERSAEVLNTIAEIGREALGEMRRIVGVLRSDISPAAEYAPTPGLPDLAEMITKAGDRVRYSGPDHFPSVPPALGLTVYRIVQESVTNFLKHAGIDATAEVNVQLTQRFIRIMVRDDGIGAASSSDGAGSGLKGMRERVATMGGQLAAGPRVEGGYEVLALLPLPQSTTRPSSNVA